MKKYVLISLACLALSSCTTNYASRGEQLYLQSKNGVMVTVPPPLTREYFSDFYVLPGQNANPRVSIQPPAKA